MAWAGGSRTRTDSAGTRDFLTDALGSTLALTDSSGALQTQYSYEPFGKTTASGAASTNSFEYTGRENDGMGLYYYRARYYNPATGRFVSEDPAGFGGGTVDLYSYVANNPLGHVDPSGENPTAGRAGTIGVQGGSAELSDPSASNNGPTISASAPQPWYGNSCITGALGDAALPLGLDAVGLIPEAGGIARVIGHQAGYIGVVADQAGFKVVDAFGKSTSTAQGLNGLFDASPQGLISTGLTVAGFIPGIGQGASIGSIIRDTYKTAEAISQCP